MRTLTLAVLLSGCSQVAGPVGPQGPAGPPGVGADPVMVMAMASEIAALRDRVEKVEARAKVPWFVDGETKEPIGRVLDYGDRIAWSDELGAPVAVGAVAVYYAEPGCRGEARVTSARARFVIVPDGSVVEPMPSAGDFAHASTLAPGAACRDLASSPQPGFRSFRQTGATLPATGGNQVGVELR